MSCGYGSRIALACARLSGTTVEDTTPHSRGAICVRVLHLDVPLEKEGAGNAGCSTAPAFLWAEKKNAHKSSGRAETSGTPCAMALRLLRALPGVPGFLATIACGKHP